MHDWRSAVDDGSAALGTAENVRQQIALGAAGKVVAGVQSLSIGLEYGSLSFREIEGSIRFSAYTPTHPRLGPMAFFGRTRKAKSILTRPQAARAWLHVKRVSKKYTPLLQGGAPVVMRLKIRNNGRVRSLRRLTIRWEIFHHHIISCRCVCAIERRAIL